MRNLGAHAGTFRTIAYDMVGLRGVPDGWELFDASLT